MAMPRLGENRKCTICGKQFYAERARIKRGDKLIYCSTKCRGVGVRSPTYKKICEYCGQEFYVKQSELARGKASTFCSQGCWGYYRREGNYYQQERYRPKYREWRRRVFERDGYECQECEMDNHKLNAHHILGFSEYPHLAYDVDNGITLCEKCHWDKHRVRSNRLFGRFKKIEPIGAGSSKGAM